MPPNRGNLAAIAAAAHAGQFQRQTGQWPRDRAELERVPCPYFVNDDVRKTGRHPARCLFLADLPYTVEMRPLGHDLEMEFRDGSGHRICRLRVIAPRAPAGTDLAPLSIIRTGLFSCPGEPGKKS